MDEIRTLPIKLKKGARTFPMTEQEKETRKKVKIEKMKKREEEKVKEAEDRLEKRKTRLRKLKEITMVLKLKFYS